mgnify:CR=1 FL=1
MSFPQTFYRWRKEYGGMRVAQMTADVVYSSYPLRAVCHQRHFDHNGSEADISLVEPLPKLRSAISRNAEPELCLIATAPSSQCDPFRNSSSHALRAGRKCLHRKAEYTYSSDI